ncbi:branched-chain amino acid ABC transporter permease [Mesorhizobium sp. ASY16-5R]|uniref:branched-chain amino acid ABC transporter permease n=1 Tax=Mesorhizobium sp. ASY16-5R TaxID=3445772 RepID=UPI003FA05619
MRTVVALVLLALVLATVPFLASQGTIYFVTLILIWSIFAVAYDLVFGLTGLLSFGHAAFFGTGAFVFALMTQAFPDLFALGLLAAIAAAAVAAAMAGMLALRLSGIYFSLTTLAIAELIFFATSSPLRALSGGEDGIAGIVRPSLFGISFYDDTNFYLLVLVIFMLVLAGCAVFRESPFGKVLSGIRLNEIRAEQVGFNTKLSKLIVFVVSGAVSGLAGALLVSLMMFFNPQLMHWTASGDVVIMTLLGGKGTLLGPVLGVAAYEVAREQISSYTVHWYGILGICFILATLYMPNGLVGLVRAIVARVGGGRS